MKRIVNRLRYNWKFTRGAVTGAELGGFDDSSWEAVSVPHDWAIAGPFAREHDIDRNVAQGQADVEADVGCPFG
jgi:beta-galactosidase